LMQLYLADDNWPKASPLLRTLISSHEQDPRLLIVYVAQLLKHHETDSANLSLHRLEQLAPNEFATASLKAESLVQGGQIDSAIQALRDSLARTTLSKADATAQTRATAARLEELAVGLTDAKQAAPNQATPNQATQATKLFAEAESLYRKFVKDQPEQELMLATFLARRGRSDEAIAVAVEAQPTADPNALANACVEIMEKLPGLAVRDPRLEKVLRAAIAQHGDSAVLQIALADLRIRQERFDDAAAVYREALERDPANFVAMNNLAILLSLEKKHLDEAERLVATAIASAGPVPALLDSRATVYLALGKPTEALADLEKAIAVEPKPNRQFHLALAYLQLGQTQAAAKAMDDASKAGFKPEELNPLERPMYEELAGKIKR
jgi:tetratricopeptide (TPR) repeat protein